MLSKQQFFFYTFGFALLIVGANYTVQFPINDYLTYGAILYPITFLLSDILSEKFTKEEVLKVVRAGVLLAIVPTILIADLRIALASVVTFFLIQQFDVYIFHYIKQKYQHLWWLRNNGSTMISQFFDTSMFFILAFSFVMPFEQVVKLIIGDYMVKIILALADTPFFYFFAIRGVRAR
jgi:uncharacterized PurR-regulated membrane protein YhhQ (DUF165 family)